MKAKGHYGIYGGQYVAETLMGPLAELEKAYAEAKADPEFQREFEGILRDYVGANRPSRTAEGYRSTSAARRYC